MNTSEILSQCKLFTGIEKEKMPDIVKYGQVRDWQSGDILFHEGDPAVQFFLVLNGRLKLSKLHEDGKEVLVRYITPGEMTAAVSVFNEKNYPATAHSIGATKVIGWGRKALMKIMTFHPQFAINLLHTVVDRLDDIQNRYLELHAERAEQRIARALLRLMKQSGRKTAEGVLIDFRLSRQDLADYTGTTLYTVSRTLSLWEKKGWVSSGRERIVITDPHALVTFSEPV